MCEPWEKRSSKTSCRIRPSADRVASADPDTGRPATATFTHRDVDTMRVSTDRGELVATAAHPLYAQGRVQEIIRGQPHGSPPPVRAGQGLRPRRGPEARRRPARRRRARRPRDPRPARRTVHNIEVDTTHAYYIATTGTWALAHNGCTWDDAAGEWIDTETGKPRTPTRFSELVSSKGRINYDDVNRLAT